jgi:predicted O-linked N-acetylglucosamine transferase (SPINDLY family)
MLKRVPHAVLWLLHMPYATPNLKAAVAAAGVAADRVQFHHTVDNIVHMRRTAQCDLFVDNIGFGRY